MRTISAKPARGVWTLLMLLLLSGLCWAQEDSATLTGQVTDPEDRPIPGAQVTITETGVSTITDREGGYQFKVPPGSYTLVVVKDGFHPLDKLVTVTARETLTVHFQLPRLIAQLGEEVVVVGSRAARAL